MDRKRNISNTSRRLRNTRPQRRTNRRTLLERRNRRQGLNRNRNRLFRAQNNINRNKTRPGQNNNRRRYNYSFNRRNPRFRIIFVANMPFNINSRMLRNLFSEEGRINQASIIRGRNGSKGYGFVEFYNPRDAWRSIQKWNNTFLGGRRIVVQYRKKRRNRNNFGNRGFNGYNNNYQRFNQVRQGNNGYRRNNYGGYRPRGNRYY